jgi:hypothetical protein
LLAGYRTPEFRTVVQRQFPDAIGLTSPSGVPPEITPTLEP